jgi:copper(I)-binding protein
MKLFSGRIPTSTTLYVPLTIVNGSIGAHIGWLDATSAATLTIELSSIPGVSSLLAGAAWQWKDSGVSITGPAASAAGAAVVNLENVRQARARLKIVTTAVSQFEIHDVTP